MDSTILIVDDDAAMLELLAIVLKRRGFSVITTTDPTTALDLINAAQPHLIISDLMMPEINGYELCQQIRRQPEHDARPVLILSAKNDLTVIQQCLAAGATEYALK